VKAVEKRLREELSKLQVEINEEKSRTIDLSKGERFFFWVSSTAAFWQEMECGGHC
jgi:hypothetical protein